MGSKMKKINNYGENLSLTNFPHNYYIPKKRYGGSVKSFLKVMKALSDPSRVKIMKMLQRRVMCVCEIQAALGIAQSTASKHLKILEDAGLITYQKDGLWVNYELADGSQSPFAASLIGNLRHWLEDNPDMKKLLERLSGIHRENICGK
jgi:ArsR family transcriptional regulator, arsenate/arsenite/antimonite-responsive transcriptional repressor